MDGYFHPLYAQSFIGIGKPIFLPNSEGWLIQRGIPETSYFDAMGPYPLFFCKRWEQLTNDIIAFSKDLITVSLVISPMDTIPITEFREFFDVFFDYRDHYIIDTSIPIRCSISKKRYLVTRKALDNVKVDYTTAPNIDLDEWSYLYAHLIEKHNISGVRAFSRNSFEQQIKIPDTHFFRVFYKDELVGGALFYLQNDTAYYHLSALTPRGYELHAAYALIWTAIDELSKKIRWIELQGGSSESNMDGLSEFKKGWANSSKKSHFCGKILNKEIYQDIIYQKKIPKSNWFPAYRLGEYS